MKAQEEMKDKKQEIELSMIGEGTGYKHRILDRKFIDDLTAKALEEIENEQMEMAWWDELAIIKVKSSIIVLLII